MIEVQLTKGAIALIDDDDSDLLLDSWTVMECHGLFYAKKHLSPRNGGKTILMHRLIFERMTKRNLLSTELTDHINRNGLDNRRSNLRMSSHQQNQGNRKAQSNSLSGFKGVSKSKSKSHPWRARIRFNGKQTHLGSFQTIEEAHTAYCEAAITLFGEFWRAE